MAISAFPPVELADEYGLLAVGGDLEVSSLLLAYRSGIFPWPLVGERRITWFAPPKRAIIETDKFRCSRSLTRTLSKGHFNFKLNNRFDEVISSCRELRVKNGEAASWITNQMVEAYTELHLAGHAHSIETYSKGKMVGGLYGVLINRYFAGESMFYRESDASKAALCVLCQYLNSVGIGWIDCQVMSPHLHSLGAREIDRFEFMNLLDAALNEEEIQFTDSRLRTFLLAEEILPKQ